MVLTLSGFDTRPVRKSKTFLQCIVGRDRRAGAELAGFFYFIFFCRLRSPLIGRASGIPRAVMKAQVDARNAFLWVGPILIFFFSISGSGSEGCQSGRWAQWVSADRVLFVPPALPSCSGKLGSRGGDKQKGATVSHADAAFPNTFIFARSAGGSAAAVAPPRREMTAKVIFPSLSVFFLYYFLFVKQGLGITKPRLF